jgi:hypothetical protein
MSLRKWLAVIAGVALGVTGLSSSASAVVIYDAEGEYDWDWFVGKGDVQSAFGWNAKQTDARFDEVTFRYELTVTTVFGCVDTERGTYNEVVGSMREVSATIRKTAVDTRRNKASVTTGFFLTKGGQPIKDESSSSCDEGWMRNNLRETTRSSVLIATFDETDKVIWILE